MCQVQWYLELLDLPVGYLAVFFDRQLSAFVVSRDRELGAMMVEEATAFWNDYVLPRREPPFEGAAAADYIHRKFPRVRRSLQQADVPDDILVARRDLIQRHRYLVPNSIVVSRGCPHVCDFCYKEAFFQGGRGFYTQTVDAALDEISRLPGRHLYFLDDHLFGNAPFAAALFDGMLGMGRLWQAAGTVESVLRPGLLEKAVDCGLRSLFVGFETLNSKNLV